MKKNGSVNKDKNTFTTEDNKESVNTHQSHTHIGRCQLLLMIEDVNIFSRASLQGSSDERDMGGPAGKVSAAQRTGGATSDITPRDQKLGCSPPVRPHSGASRRSDPGEVEEMEDEEETTGRREKREGVVGEVEKGRESGGGC